jgi:hypothetical protein
MSQAFETVTSGLYELPTTVSKLARDVVNSLGGQLFTNAGETTQTMVVVMGVAVLFLLQLIGSLLPSEAEGHKNWEKFRIAIGVVVTYGLAFSAIGAAMSLKSVNAITLLLAGGAVWFIGYGLNLGAKEECRVGSDGSYGPLPGQGYPRSGTDCTRAQIAYADLCGGILLVGATTAASSIIAYLRNSV